MRRSAVLLAQAEPRDAPPDTTPDSIRLHATCVEVLARGVLLLGRSGSGKSDLALRLIDRGGCLVADDQLLVERSGPALLARAPAELFGLIEVRGFGIVRLPARPSVPLALAVDLDRSGHIPRLPPPGQTLRLLDLELPLLRLDPRSPSAPAVIRLTLGAERVT
jgi:HPr kinase/phosphorylase